ncbi:signal recognition particle-docking protein FtsY [Sansalvadorimonas verongulae]|uniref:signal recognition particle-docking protein FtsY n=1 Tax=Sansalvadorimonas verongulae TaxID=2172824 RepID=UPI0012BB80D3|nr:signal recognition particle-docking protein FtsY [Sansalvadorimonas verongulae]MTI13412.1 signal recognition particle-docking protein FtsY [Sansalvadorimonas verongulae]
MFGSKKDDKSSGAKRRFWPFGRKQEEAPAEQPAEVSVQPEEPAQKPADEVASAPAPAVEPVADPVPATTPEETAPEPVQEIKPEPEPVAEASAPVVQVEPAPEIEEEAEEAGGFFSRMKSGLSKTRASLVEGVTTLFIGKKEIDDELLEDLETQLLVSDVGIDATRQIIDGLTQRVAYKELDDADALVDALKAELAKILKPADKPLVIDTTKKPFVILVVGVNGVGKTTTIGKMARQFQNEGKKVMLAAGDTFRAAAVEQLQVWGERNDIPVVAQHTGADSASVLYDALEAAKARQMDILIADTAGRLHNKDNLMEELKKVKRVLGKIDPEAPHEVLLVVDAGTGQNALNQARLFDEAVGLTGMALTKLDGTAKGGVTFALSQQMQLPIRFLGVGEQIADLRPFNADEFVDALFADIEV